MKKILLVFCTSLMVSFFSMLGVANASGSSGHYVCKSGGSNDCWFKYDGIEYRGKQNGKPTGDIIKEETAKAEKEASKLEGKALVEAANAATMEAAVAKLKVAALNNRIAALGKKQAENKKKGIKSRGWWGNCYYWHDVYGNSWYQCY